MINGEFTSPPRGEEILDPNVIRARDWITREFEAYNLFSRIASWAGETACDERTTDSITISYTPINISYSSYVTSQVTLSETYKPQIYGSKNNKLEAEGVTLLVPSIEVNRLDAAGKFLSLIFKSDRPDLIELKRLAELYETTKGTDVVSISSKRYLAVGAGSGDSAEQDAYFTWLRNIAMRQGIKLGHR